MAVHRSRRPTSSDSGYSSTDSTPSLDRVKDLASSIPPQIIAVEDLHDHVHESNNTSLLSIATCTDLASSIGTELSGIQLSNLNAEQLNELAVLVSERGVVFLRDQDITHDLQIQISEHFGKYVRTRSILTDQDRARGAAIVQPVGTERQLRLKKNEWSSDRSWEATPPSFSMLLADEAGGDTTWVSQYGLYDNLSVSMKRFVDDLHAMHVSQSRSSIPVPESSYTHPAVRTHPITGLKALNFTPGEVTGFVELTERESHNILQLLEHNINSSDEYTVRFRWEAGSVAIWDNRCTAFKHIRKPQGSETSCAGEKPYYDPQSESRDERTQRIAREAEDERLRLEEIKRRYNDTPLRRILRAQSEWRRHSFQSHRNTPIALLTKTEDEEESKKEETPYVFRLRSNSEIREQEKAVWAQSSSRPKETAPRQPLFKLRSESEMRQYEAEIWAKSPSVEVKEGREFGLPDTKRPTKVRANSNGSPLRRILQRQASGRTGARQRD